jgi:hypothetical protein
VTNAAPAPNSASTAEPLSQTGRARPGGLKAWANRWTRPSKFVKLPSISANVGDGSTMSALRAAALMMLPT